MFKDLVDLEVLILSGNPITEFKGLTGLDKLHTLDEQQRKDFFKVQIKEMGVFDKLERIFFDYKWTVKTKPGDEPAFGSGIQILDAGREGDSPESVVWNLYVKMKLYFL